MSVKSAPFSMRLSKRMEALVQSEAARTGRSKGAVVEALADVWQIVDAYRDIGSVERMIEGGSVSERGVDLALAYYERFPEEIDAAIVENHRPIEQLRDEFPFIAVSQTRD
jgi:hypothetical protein